VKAVVFDTNVWVSALAFRGRLRDLWYGVVAGSWDVAVSDEILGELKRVLMGRKLGYPPEMAELIVGNLRPLVRLVHPTRKVRFVVRDPDDNRILECALSAGAEAVVTGDRDLLELGSFQGIRIMEPGAFLEEIDPAGDTPGPLVVR